MEVLATPLPKEEGIFGKVLLEGSEPKRVKGGPVTLASCVA